MASARHKPHPGYSERRPDGSYSDLEAKTPQAPGGCYCLLAYGVRPRLFISSAEHVRPGLHTQVGLSYTSHLLTVGHQPLPPVTSLPGDLHLLATKDFYLLNPS